MNAMCKKIRFLFVVLKDAQELAAYNFKHHKSVEYLDLSINEVILKISQPSYFKTVFTQEDILKRIIPERKILYDFHLDLPRNLESFCYKNRVEATGRQAFHLKKVAVLDVVFNRNLERCIVAVIVNDTNKIEKLRSFMKSLKLLKFHIRFNASIYFCDHILPMLYNENCTDSELLRSFLQLFDLLIWLSRTEKPKVLAYILSRAQRARFLKDLWRCTDFPTDAATFCFLCHKKWNMRLLIDFGINPSIPRVFNFGDFVPGNMFDIAFGRGVVSYPRAFRIFQLLYSFVYHPPFGKELGYIWRSIKDPFLTTTEIDSFFKLSVSSNTVKLLQNYYKNCIGRSNSNIEYAPRKLQHLCRVDIRGYLGENHQVPFGINKLDITEILKPYLYLQE